MRCNLSLRARNRAAKSATDALASIGERRFRHSGFLDSRDMRPAIGARRSAASKPRIVSEALLDLQALRRNISTGTLLSSALNCVGPSVRNILAGVCG
jgi:hypothetical protein